jgi:hypothetical protein
MKTCSSWNWDTLDYTYYNGPGAHWGGGWKPPTPTRMRADSSLGIHIEEALPNLPGGCTKTGRGVDAKGQIVKPQGSGGMGSLLSLDPVPSKLFYAASIVGVGLALYGAIKRKPLPGIAGAALLYGAWKSGMWTV